MLKTSSSALDNNLEFLFGELAEYGMEQSYDVFNLSKFFFNVSGCSIVPYHLPGTLQYQVRGADTLTVGDQMCWYNAKKLQSSMSLLSASEYGLKIEDAIPKYYPPPTSLIFHRNPDAAIPYLACHPEIDDFLNEALPFLEKSFEGPVDIHLEVINYPEENYDELVGWIQFAGSVNEGLDKLEQFEDEWFLDNMNKVGDEFSFNIEIK